MGANSLLYKHLTILGLPKTADLIPKKVGLDWLRVLHDEVYRRSVITQSPVNVSSEGLKTVMSPLGGRN